MAWESKIPSIKAQARPRAVFALGRLGEFAEDVAQAHARVDTGYMRAQLRWRRTGVLKGALEGGAHYTIWHEIGTRHMDAQPMLAPALLAVEQRTAVEFRIVFQP